MGYFDMVTDGGEATVDQRVVGIVQARMGSERLPGKMMLPLAGKPVIVHDVRRIERANSLDEVVVATTDKTCDDLIERHAAAAGAEVFRGDESDVLGRMYEAAREYDANIVVRMTGDCPLISPRVIDASVRKHVETGADYTNNYVERSFPRGLEVEVVNMDEFGRVEALSERPAQREHVTQYYIDHSEEYEFSQVYSTDVFDDDRLHDRMDLRLALDEADDYHLLRTIYENVPFEYVLPFPDAAAYVDRTGVDELNSHVENRTAYGHNDGPDDQG